MKMIPWLSAGCFCALVACSGTGSKAIYHPDVGPFDENGDYVVALADAPVRKNIFSRTRRKATPTVEKVAVPQTKKVQRVAKVTPQPAPRVVPQPAPRAVPQPVAIRPPSGPVLIAQSPRPTANPLTGPRAVVPAPAPVAAPRPAPKPKPKPVVVKPKKKAPVRHVVRKSDTLYGLSRKYGVSVSSIQRANGLKGSKIITGKTLLIPR